MVLRILFEARPKDLLGAGGGMDAFPLSISEYFAIMIGNCSEIHSLTHVIDFGHFGFLKVALNPAGFSFVEPIRSSHAKLSSTGVVEPVLL
jgi:hypothetical protein